jgi:phospholipid/cholesterol/gamma-HCH transport system substrate-binding protein
MGKLVTPFRVGILVIIAIVGFGVGFSFVHKGGLSKRDALECFAYFNDASGLGPKSRIQIAGIAVGEVENITLEGQRAKVTLLIRRTVPVKTDAMILKRSESLLGDYMLDLSPGSEQAKLLEDGGQITRVQDQTGMEQIFGTLGKITSDIQEVTAALRSTLGGEQGAQSLQHIIANLSQMSDQLNDTIRLNGERLDAILTNFQGVSEDIRGITGGEEARYKLIVENVQKITEDVREVLASVKKVLGTGEGNIQDAAVELRQTLAKLDKSLENVQDITGKIDKGEGTVGQLVNDKRLGQALTDTVVDASDYVSRLVNIETQLTIQSEFLFSEKQAKTHLMLTLIPSPDKYYTFEVVEDPQGLSTQTVVFKSPPGSTEVPEQTQTTVSEQLKFSALFNKRFYFVGLHFGVIESTGGLGLDLHFLDDSLTFKVDAFDFADQFRSLPQLRASASYAILKHVYFTGGMNDILNDPTRDPQTRKLLAGREAFLGGGIFFTDDDLKAVLSAAPVKF